MGQGSTGYLKLKNIEKLKKELELRTVNVSLVMDFLMLSLQFEMNKTPNLNLTSLCFPKHVQRRQNGLLNERSNCPSQL